MWKFSVFLWLNTCNRQMQYSTNSPHGSTQHFVSTPYYSHDAEMNCIALVVYNLVWAWTLAVQFLKLTEDQLWLAIQKREEDRHLQFFGIVNLPPSVAFKAFDSDVYLRYCIIRVLFAIVEDIPLEIGNIIIISIFGWKGIEYPKNSLPYF